MLSGYRLSESDPFHDQVLAWLFPAGITTHVLLVAGLRTPTVRTRYVAVRELLTAYGHSEFFEPLLEPLGCAQMSRASVEQHLAALARAFNAAKAVIKSPFFFASHLSDAARPIVIDGSRQLIERGAHREAIFWMAVTYSRCQKVLYHDATRDVYEQFEIGFRRLLGDLGFASFADLQWRSEQVEAFLPRVWGVAEAIMAVNRGIAE